MKLLVAADMEGITGVVDWNHVDSTHPEYARFRRQMTADVNAAIHGAFAGGVDEVVVSDGHGDKTNLLIEEIDPRARLNSGSGPLAMVQGIDGGVDAIFFVGYHAKAGTPNAILCHTVSSRRIRNVWLNGKLVGEAGMNAATCGYYGAPVLLATGDLALCREASEELPGTETVTTKRASGMAAAECLPPEVTARLIEEAAEKAVLRFKNGLGPAPVRLDGPAQYTIEFVLASQADRAAMVPGAERLEGRKVALRADVPPEAYKQFRAAMLLAGD